MLQLGVVSWCNSVGLHMLPLDAQSDGMENPPRHPPPHLGMYILICVTFSLSTCIIISVSYFLNMCFLISSHIPVPLGSHFSAVEFIKLC